jgi:hypothetical protein
MGMRDFASFIVERGAATHGEVLAAIDQQLRSRLTIGRLALQLGLLDASQVFAVLARQTRIGKNRFGEVAIEMKLLTQHQVNELLLEQRKRTPPIESFLVRAGVLDIERANELREDFDRATPSSSQIRAVVPRAKTG